MDPDWRDPQKLTDLAELEAFLEQERHLVVEPHPITPEPNPGRGLALKPEETQASLLDAIDACLEEAVLWETQDGEKFDPARLPSFDIVTELLDRGEWIGPSDTLQEPTTENPDPYTLIGWMNWQSYCIADDEKFSWDAGDRFDETCFEILKVLVERGFEITGQESTFSEFGEKMQHAELAAIYKERHLQQALAPTPPPAERRIRPRM